MRPPLTAALAGAVVATLGGLIGLGGAEFRLPLLVGLFRFAALHAVIINKAISLIVVASALPFRSIPFTVLASYWHVVINLLAGSLLGAWLGAGWATRLTSRALHRALAILLILMAAVLMLGHGESVSQAPLSGIAQQMAGVVAGFAIGVVAAIMGVAGGELLIPTIIVLFGADIKLAGSLSLVVSLPTMIVGFARYARDRSFAVLGENIQFVGAMAVGSLAGSFFGAHLLGLVATGVLIPLLAAILLLSAVKVWRQT